MLCSLYVLLDCGEGEGQAEACHFPLAYTRKRIPSVLVSPGELSHSFPREIRRVDTPTSTSPQMAAFPVGARWCSLGLL